MAILEHDAFMSDELRRVPLKELTNRLDSFRRVMTCLLYTSPSPRD